MEIKQKENVIDIPVENTPYNLFIHNDDWLQNGIAPKDIVDAGLIEGSDSSYMLCCFDDCRKNFIRDKKRSIAKGYGYSTWTQMLSERGRQEISSFYEMLITEIINGKSRPGIHDTVNLKQ